MRYWILLATLITAGLLGGGVVAGSRAINRSTAGTAAASPGCTESALSDPFMGMAPSNEPYDARFIDAMVMHHEGAIVSAQMMIANSSRPALRDLAHRIITSQQQQVTQMLAWRKAWYGSSTTQAPSKSMNDMMQMMSMMGMMGNGMAATPTSGMMSGGMMGGMMGGMATATSRMSGMMGGALTDEMFLKMMIPHHQLAIDMAQDALTHAQHPQIKTLAREIIQTQSAEITEMEGYLRAWYGASSTRGLADTMRTMMGCMMGEQ